MSDIAMDTAGVTPELTAGENAFFESGGEVEVADGGGEAWTGEGEGEQAASQDDDASRQRQRAEKMVSLAALHEERGRRKDLDRRNRDLETQLAEMRGRFQIIERLNTTDAAPEQPVTPESDIFGYARKTGESVAALQKRLDAQEAERQNQNARSHIVSAYRADAAQFEAQNPDFKAAYQHLLNARVQELTSLGYDNAQAMHQALMSDEMSIAYSALQRGRSPAEIIYNLAQQRGYNGGRNSAASRLDTIERGQFANKSLSNAGGFAGDGDVSAEMLLRMPIEEFEAWCTKNPGRAKRIMGG